MELLKLLAIVAIVLLCGSYDDGLHIGPRVLTTVSKSESSSLLPHRKIYGSPIPYYSNSTATFQLQLLDCGDVNPNPGPERSTTHSSTPIYHDVNSYHTPNRKYDIPFLKSLNLLSRNDPQVFLNSNVLRLISELGISKNQGRWKKTSRGKRAGSRKQRPDHFSSNSDSNIVGRPIPVIISNRSQRDNKSQCVRRSHSSLKSVPLKGDQKILEHFSTRVGVWNARSMMNKQTEISDFIITENLDVLVITEAWLTGDSRDSTTIADI